MVAIRHLESTPGVSERCAFAIFHETEGVILGALSQSDCCDFTLQSCDCLTNIRNRLFIEVIVLTVIQDELQCCECIPGYLIFHGECDHSALRGRSNLKYNSRDDELEVGMR